MRSGPLVLGLTGLVLSLALTGASVGQPQPRLMQAGLDDSNHIPYPAREILEHADRFELLSLSPEHLREPAKNDFHGFRVLGQTSITSTEIRRKLVAAFELGVSENDGVIAACFNPRHGIRVVHRGKQADFVICFECRQVRVVGEGAGEFLVSNSPQPVFDKVLGDAHVPLP